MPSELFRSMKQLVAFNPLPVMCFLKLVIIGWIRRSRTISYHPHFLSAYHVAKCSAPQTFQFLCENMWKSPSQKVSDLIESCCSLAKVDFLDLLWMLLTTLRRANVAIPFFVQHDRCISLQSPSQSSIIHRNSSSRLMFSVETFMLSGVYAHAYLGKSWKTFNLKSPITVLPLAWCHVLLN